MSGDEPDAALDVTGDAEFTDIARELRQARKMIAAWTTVRDECEARIKKLLDAHSEAVVGGQPVVVYRPVRSRVLDQKLLRDAAPDLVAHCTVERVGRPFRFLDAGWDEAVGGSPE